MIFFKSSFVWIIATGKDLALRTNTLE